MKRLLVLCSVVLLFSCANREEVVEQTYPNGNKKIVLVYEGKDTDRKVIEQKSFYIGGQPEVTGQFDENAKRAKNKMSKVKKKNHKKRKKHMKHNNKDHK